MAMRPLVHYFRQRPSRHFALLALLLIGAAAWYVTARGGWGNVLQLPPILDASTPRTQNGFTLLDIQRPVQWQGGYGSWVSAGFRHEGAEYRAISGPSAIDTADAFGLWIKPVAFPVSRFGSDIDSRSSMSAGAFSAAARLSTGETLPLEWHLRGVEHRLLLVTLPSGYSADCRFVDFTITDRSGHVAHWRITRLPRMRHAVPPPSAFTDTVTASGITMSVRAWHGSGGQVGGLISYVLHPALPPNSHQWDVLTTEQAREWEPFSYDGHVRIYETSGTPILGRNGVFDTDFERWYGGGIRGFVGTDYYPRMTRSLRLVCALRQFETYDEPVTFHNVAVRYDEDTYRANHEKVYFLELPRPLQVTTPSGVMVTLPVQGNRFRPTLFGGALNFFVAVQPKVQEEPITHALPNSPLAHTFGKPVKISLEFPPPYRREGWSYERDGVPANYAMGLPLNPAWHPTRGGIPTAPMYKDLPPVLKDMTLIVRQRVDLRTIPMIFTLPITEEAPAYYPKGYRLPRHP